MATWFREGRGLAIGVLVGAVTVGKATPYRLKALGGGSSATAIGWSSVSGVLAAVAVGIAAVAAIIDPFRFLPNGMDGIVGMFCVTWAEFVTFAAPVALLVLLVPSDRETVAAPAVSAAA